MSMGDYLVVTATALNMCACLAYFSMGDNPRAVYWFGAFLITGSTIFIGR